MTPDLTGSGTLRERHCRLWASREPTDGYPSALKEKRHLLSTRMEYIPGSTDGYPSALKEKHHLLSTRMEYIPGSTDAIRRL
jgi:hypothetical protein